MTNIQTPATITHEGFVTAGQEGGGALLDAAPPPLMTDQQIVSFILRRGHAHPGEAYAEPQMNWARETLQALTNQTPYRVICACRVLIELSPYEDERAMAEVIRRDHNAKMLRYETRFSDDKSVTRWWSGWSIALLVIVGAVAIWMALA
jgi:hypothetical protein